MFLHVPMSFRPFRVSGALGIVAALGLLLTLGIAVAAERAFQLRDGSVLMGELIAVAEGRYRIRSAALGEIELPESQILAIRSAPPASAPGSPPIQSAVPADASDLPRLMAGIQQQMAGDPTLAGAIAALQNDPELLSALADPGFTQLILSGNLTALGTDPRFLRLMANPAIQSILGQVGGRLGGQGLGR